jgi:dGTPase
MGGFLRIEVPSAIHQGHQYELIDSDRRLEEARKRTVAGADPAGRSPFRQDYDRILHSGAFRRLQGKTQVIAPEEGDFFRTRLTHTLEATQIGGAIAERVGADKDLVEAACMAHDLGHPPFGHVGEMALGEIMDRHGLGFEGNAQSFRILTRLDVKTPGQDDGRHYGLNLTRAVMASMIKYPWSYSERPKRGELHGGKYGVYDDDGDIKAFDFAREGLPKNTRRFEADIVEWADDTAYAVHDLEDGIRARLINLHELIGDTKELRHIAEMTWADVIDLRELAGWKVNDIYEILTDFLNKESCFEWAKRAFTGHETQKAAAKEMCSALVEHFVTAVPRRDDFDPSRPGLNIPAEVHLQNRLLVNITYELIIAQRGLASLECGQARLVRRLYGVVYADAKQLLPKQLKARLPDTRNALWARLVCDHVAGMTDRYAQRQFDRLWLGRGSVLDLV